MNRSTIKDSSRQRWEKIKEIFSAAQTLEEPKRKNFLDKNCGDDQDLRREIETLLIAHSGAEDFLEQPHTTLLFQKEDNQFLSELIGTHIGPYRLEKEIGRGGMGLVFLARRDDQVFEKQAAIKLIKKGMDSEEILRHFRNERQTLAALEHPNITRLLDGGTTENGSPYFIMEFVQGRPITEYCDSNHLTIEERLTLFRKVCSAVHYAHQNLVIHRDIKPGNILVTEDGEPKLLDFGIAKLLDPERQDQTADLTTQGNFLLTPDYASPEQITGAPITTASDIYSLGVLLYELLCGQKPYRFASFSAKEIEHILCNNDPKKPSTQLKQPDRALSSDQSNATISLQKTGENRKESPDKIQRKLRGDLDNIVLMALRKEPRQRYSSVEKFSEDIRRFLYDLPVFARKDSLPYRAGKFYRRHKLGVSAAFFIIFSLITGFIGTAWQGYIAAVERDRAQLEAAKAEQINEFLQQMLSSVDPNKKGKDVKVVDVLQEAAKRVETELVDQPEIEAAAQRTLGITFRNLGLYEQAEPHARRAAKLNKDIYGSRSLQAAKAIKDLGVLLFENGKYEESETDLRESLAIYRDLAGKDSLGLASGLDALAVLLNNKGKRDEAELLYREALAIYRNVQNTDDAFVARVLNDLGVLLGTKGSFAEAEPLHREALLIMRKIYGEEHPQVAYTLYNLAGVLDAQGNYDHAEVLYRATLDMRKKLLGAEHPYVILTQTSLANLYWLQKKYKQGIQLSSDALKIAKKALPEQHPLSAYVHIVLGQNLFANGDLKGGEKHLRTALAIRKRLYPENHWQIANTESVLGECLTGQKRFPEAEVLLLSGYKKLQENLGNKHEKTVAALKRIVGLYENWGKPEKRDSYKKLLTFY